MKRIEVGGHTPYTVHVGSGALRHVRVPERRVALLYDNGLPEQLVNEVHDRLKPELSVALPAGESCKRLDVYADVLSQLAARALPRDSAVVGLGGGAATDLAGFVASTYLRGVAFYTLPTTLLAQVDAAVGGKTGVNLPEGKNLVGTFWPPRAVWCDTDTLAFLPDRRFREGAAEAFKHGLLTDGALCEAVLRPDFTSTYEGLPGVVADAVRVKADIVTRDLTEQGERAHLNLGHTLAHALEAVTDHALPHGEAVAYGLHFAALLSRELGGQDLTALTGRFLSWMRPAELPQLQWQDLGPYVLRDKKADSDGVRFVLLRALGEPYLTRVPAATLQSVFDRWQLGVKGILAGNS